MAADDFEFSAFWKKLLDMFMSSTKSSEQTAYYNDPQQNTPYIPAGPTTPFESPSKRQGKPKDEPIPPPHDVTRPDPDKVPPPRPAVRSGPDPEDIPPPREKSFGTPPLMPICRKLCAYSGIRLFGITNHGGDIIDNQRDKTELTRDEMTQRIAAINELKQAALDTTIGKERRAGEEYVLPANNKLGKVVENYDKEIAKLNNALAGPNDKFNVKDLKLATSEELITDLTQWMVQNKREQTHVNWAIKTNATDQQIFNEYEARRQFIRQSQGLALNNMPDDHRRDVEAIRNGNWDNKSMVRDTNNVPSIPRSGPIVQV